MATRSADHHDHDDNDNDNNPVRTSRHLTCLDDHRRPEIIITITAGLLPGVLPEEGRLTWGYDDYRHIYHHDDNLIWTEVSYNDDGKHGNRQGRLGNDWQPGRLDDNAR